MVRPARRDWPQRPSPSAVALTRAPAISKGVDIAGGGTISTRADVSEIAAHQ